MPVIDVWAVLADPDIPPGVGQRLLTRQAARRRGLEPDVVPEADKPHLSRHVVVQCAHGELIRPRSNGWEHLSDNAPCEPATNPEEKTV